MPRVAVVSDTTGYLPREVAEQNGVRLVSLYVNRSDGRSTRERDIGDLDAFFEELRSADRHPTTSQPSVGDFVAAYEPLLAEGLDVVSIHIDSALSGTLESARQAAATLERDGKGGERVRLVDSSTAAGGLGMMALIAARRARSGDDIEAVVERITEARRQW